MMNRAKTLSLVATASIALLTGWMASSFGQAPATMPRTETATMPATIPARGMTRGPINVTEFGARADDELDDTAAIQRALDQAKGGLFTGRAVSGREVFIPAGKYVVRELVVFSNTTVRGEPGTMLISPTGRAAIIIRSQFGHGLASDVALEQLAISAPKGCCILNEAPNLVNSRFEHLRVSSRETAIQLLHYAQNCVLHDILLNESGSGAVKLQGNANLISRIDTEGGIQPNYAEFKPPPGMIEVEGGGNRITGCILEGSYSGCPALALKGPRYDVSNVWYEMQHGERGIALLLEGVKESRFDRLDAGPANKVVMRRCEDVKFDSVQLVGEGGVRSGFDLDPETRMVTLDHVTAAYDTGGLDDPQITVRSTYSKLGKWRIDWPMTKESGNWAKALSPASRWAVSWEKGGIDGLATEIEPKANHSGFRLKVTLDANPDERSLMVRVPIGVPAVNVGCTPWATWRADGPAGQNLVVWQQGWDHQFLTRHVGSQTAARFPSPIKDGGDLTFIFAKAKPGVYYLSDVGIYR